MMRAKVRPAKVMPNAGFQRLTKSGALLLDPNRVGIDKNTAHNAAAIRTK